MGGGGGGGEEDVGQPAPRAPVLVARVVAGGGGRGGGGGGGGAVCSGFEGLVFGVSRYDAGLVFPVGLLGYFPQLFNVLWFQGFHKIACGFRCFHMNGV